MSVMDTVSEPAQTEREKYIRSVGVRERTRCRQRVRFVCFSERETDSILEQRGKKTQRQRQFAHHAAAQVTFLTAFFQQSQC